MQMRSNFNPKRLLFYCDLACYNEIKFGRLKVEFHVDPHYIICIETRNEGNIDMKTFLFLLIVSNACGDDSTFVLDYNLSREDCTALHDQWAPTLNDLSTVFCREE